MEKSSVEKIRARFDQDVERFSNLQTGQSSTIDAPLALELLGAAICEMHPRNQRASGYRMRRGQLLPSGAPRTSGYGGDACRLERTDA